MTMRAGAPPEPASIRTLSGGVHGAFVVLVGMRFDADRSGLFQGVRDDLLRVHELAVCQRGCECMLIELGAHAGHIAFVRGLVSRVAHCPTGPPLRLSRTDQARCPNGV